MFNFLAEKFSTVFSRLTGKATLTEENVNEAIDQVRESLLQADIPLTIVDQFLKQVQENVVGQKVVQSLKPGEYFIKIVYDTLVTFLQSKSVADLDCKRTQRFLVMGLQGSGKTTTLAKLVHKIKEKNVDKSILLASVDFYRPAAVDQLEILAESVGAQFYRSGKSDPVQAAIDCAAYAKRNNIDILLLDTAGRLHVDNALLQELQEIDVATEPTQKVLVLDAMTGQESLKVAQAFADAVGFDYAILTKMDSETRGGAAFGFAYELEKPIAFVGVGEKPTDLEPFMPERMASRIIGMGDVKTLIEKAEQAIKKEEQEQLQKKLMSGKITLDDFAKQMEMMGKIGSLGTLVKYIPGMGAMNPEMIEQGEKELKRFKAIIASMTPDERSNHNLLNGDRKLRIAKGAGVAVSDINQLLDRFEKSQQFVKLFKRYGRMTGL